MRHKETPENRQHCRSLPKRTWIARETNKNLSLGQIEIRRSYSRKMRELRGKVFSELPRDRLAQFMEPEI